MRRVLQNVGDNDLNADSYDVWPVVIAFLFGMRFCIYLCTIFIFRKENIFSLCFLTIFGSRIYLISPAIEIILVLFINYSITVSR